MYILGINAYHADAAACLLKDGKLIAAIEEERIRRVKHWAGFPSESIKFCLGYAGIRIQDVDHIAVNLDSKANYWKKVWFVLKPQPSIRSLWGRFMHKRKVAGVKEELSYALGIKSHKIKATFHNVEHHRSHLASAFFVSPFEEAALLSVDGIGDFTSAMWGKGQSNHFHVLGAITCPDSIGWFYTAITQYLGFRKFGDEYKVMVLSAFGKPTYMDEMRAMVDIKPDGLFELKNGYVLSAYGNVEMTWDGGSPDLASHYSPKLEELLGLARKDNEELTQKHKDIAASAQAMYEEVFFGLLNKLHKETGSTNLCFAGGSAQNSLANGKIFENSPFREVFIQPAGYDAGGALGAAYYVWNQVLGRERGFVMSSPFWGPEYHNEEIERVLKTHNLACRFLDDTTLITTTAQLLAEGNVIGWFQGRTEWGPRALGNRSILANPARPDMKEILNSKIKKREAFRPFAPSVLEEYVSAYFTESYPVPFMEKVYMIREEKRSQIPAVTHVDGTGRLQTVSKEINPRYHALIKAFYEITGVPMLLNTSFNENEPIVNRPEEAIDCFLRTQMDVLVLGNYLVTRN